MTEPVYPDQPAAQPPSMPPVTRPTVVTAAGITLIVLGVLTLLLALILLLGAALFAGAAGPAEAELPGVGGFFGAFAGVVFVFVLIVAGFGTLQLVSGIKVLSGRSWARITGIVVAAISGVFALAGLGSEDGAIINLVLVVANAFVIFALATGGAWFARGASPAS